MFNKNLLSGFKKPQILRRFGPLIIILYLKHVVFLDLPKKVFKNSYGQTPLHLAAQMGHQV